MNSDYISVFYEITSNYIIIPYVHDNYINKNIYIKRSTDIVFNAELHVFDYYFYCFRSFIFKDTFRLWNSLSNVVDKV